MTRYAIPIFALILAASGLALEPGAGPRPPGGPPVYFGLLHTFEGQCSDGDGVADTPAEQSPSYGCPLERNTCSAPGRDSVRNFMNYSEDSCMNQFTSGQRDRMHDLVATFRGSL